MHDLTFPPFYISILILRKIKKKKEQMVLLLSYSVFQNISVNTSRCTLTINNFFLCDVDDSDLSDTESLGEEISQRMYMEACKDLHITPIKALYKALGTDRLAVVGVILKKNESKACAIGLVVLNSVFVLTFSSNKKCIESLRKRISSFIGRCL